MSSQPQDSQGLANTIWPGLARALIRAIIVVCCFGTLFLRDIATSGDGARQGLVITSQGLTDEAVADFR